MSIQELGDLDAWAGFSPCMRYRYWLGRSWEEGDLVAFVGLNPSTADHEQDDPTIRRCIGFAKKWGFGAMMMLNIFTWRATDPRELRQVDDPIGPGATDNLLADAASAQLVVACWGCHGGVMNRGPVVRDLLEQRGVSPHVLGLTQAGHPRHPLYLPKTTPHVPWK